TDPEHARGCLNAAMSEPVDVHDRGGPFDVLAHEIYQRRSAGEKERSARRRGNCRVIVFCPKKLKRNHHAFRTTSSIAATMPGYAPQRQMLPLIHSRISSGEP